MNSDKGAGSELDDLARRIDTASDRKDRDALHQLDISCLEHLKSSIGLVTPTLWYYRANIQAALRPESDAFSWNWRKPYREREILFLRSSRNSVGFKDLNAIVRCQVTTNLGNSLNHIGRCIEALAVYDAAILELPEFAMARGNRGSARIDFARSLHDDGHFAVALLAAHDDLLSAAGDDAVWDSTYAGVREQFLQLSKKIAIKIDLNATRSLDLDSYSLGRSRKEKMFRKWALDNQLFLNPLNVIGRQAIAATDRFGLPAYQSLIGKPPQFIAWFNQLKQEYVAARFNLFEAEQDSEHHFADHELMLVDTLDHSVYGLRLEKLRLAFRAAYGLLDKIAGFINAYFELGGKPERISMRNVWLTKDGKSIRPEFAERSNWSLQGLYWIAFDIVGNESSEPDAIAPEAIELSRLRNALEHRCLILKEFDSELPSGALETCSVDTFRARTFQIIRLVRESLIYLSLAVGREEQLRAESNKGLAMPITLPTYKVKHRHIC